MKHIERRLDSDSIVKVPWHTLLHKNYLLSRVEINTSLHQICLTCRMQKVSFFRNEITERREINQENVL